MIPLGAIVDVTNHGGRWRGVVTGHPGPYSIEINGRLTAPSNLAKVVGEMETLSDVISERDALRELVVAQATANAELAQELERTDPDEGLKARVEELQEWVKDVQSCLEDVLLLLMGERQPVRPVEPYELRRLVDFVFEGV